MLLRIVVTVVWVSFISIQSGLVQGSDIRLAPSVLMTTDGQHADMSLLSPSPISRGSSSAACFNTSELLSVDLRDDEDNIVVDLNIGAENELTGLAWDVTLTSNAPSQVNQARLLFEGSDASPGIILTPGFGTPETGIVSFSSEQVVNFIDLGFGNPVTDDDGVLRLEFFELEDNDDFPDATDASWNDAGDFATCSGVRLICSDQLACDDAVLALAPNLDITSRVNDFGSINLGSSSALMTSVISNSTDNILRIHNIETAAGAFVMADTSSCPATPFNLDNTSSCSIDFIFSPTVLGEVSQVLEIESNSPIGSQNTITLQGVGVQPALSITPSMVAFGDVQLNQTTEEQLVTLNNPGTSLLTIDQITAPLGGFSQTGNGNCGEAPIQLLSNTSCTLAFSFTPTETGAMAQTLMINSDAPDSPGSIELTGNGVQGELRFSASGLNFGSQLLDNPETMQTLTVQNQGTGSLTIQSFDLPIEPFGLTSSGSCGPAPFTLAAAAECTLEFTFMPLEVGAVMQSLTFISDGVSGIDVLGLEGIGIQPELSITPNSIDFGDVQLGITSNEQLVTLSNSGTALLNIETISATSAAFVRTGTGSCGSTPISLAIDASCTMAFNFMPVVTGEVIESVQVSNDGSSNPGIIQLNGNGTEAILNVTSEADFGTQILAQTSVIRSITLSSVGTTALEVSSIEAVNNIYRLENSTCDATPFTLPANTSCTLDYSFTPITAGLHNNVINIESTSNVLVNNPLLTGIGRLPELLLEPSKVRFLITRIGEINGPFNVSMANTDTDTVILGDIVLLGPLGTEFVITTDDCSRAVLDPNNSCSFDITYVPTQTGTTLVELVADQGSGVFFTLGDIIASASSDEIFFLDGFE